MPPPPIPSAWRFISLALGVVWPALIWSLLAGIACSESDGYEKRGIGERAFLGACAIFAFVEIGCMVWWLLPLRRGAQSERRYFWTFTIGTVFASAWSLDVLFILLREPENILAAVAPSVAWMTFSPFASVLIYGINARIARDRARALAGAG